VLVKRVVAATKVMALYLHNYYMFYNYLASLIISRAVVQTPGGILLPEANVGKSNEGEVLAVGPGRLNREGKHLPVSVAVGDKVLLPEYGGVSIKNGEDELFLYREEEILAKVH
jgi:chaperonin GroES